MRPKTHTHMTLGFTTHFPDGSPTLFEQKILLPYEKQIQLHYPHLLPKIHTFRLGKRWKAGMKMHMVTGNRTKDRRQFNIEYPELEYCVSVQDCIIRAGTTPMPCFSIEVDGATLENDILFLVNDGFNGPDQFFEWFGHPFKSTEHVGQIIHFTDFKYPAPVPEKEQP